MKRETTRRLIDPSAIVVVVLISIAMISLAIAFSIVKSFAAAAIFISIIPVSLVATKIVDLRRLVGIVILAGLLSSCVSPYYWGATATAHGARAQNKYIKNQKGHNPHKRFQGGGHQPTFGAHDLSRR